MQYNHTEFVGTGFPCYHPQFQWFVSHIIKTKPKYQFYIVSAVFFNSTKKIITLIKVLYFWWSIIIYNFTTLGKALVPSPLYETCPLVYQSQVYITVCSHTQHAALQLLSTWRLVPALNVGHHQASVQEHVNIYRNFVLYGWRSRPFTLKIHYKCI